NGARLMESNFCSVDIFLFQSYASSFFGMLAGASVGIAGEGTSPFQFTTTLNALAAGLVTAIRLMPGALPIQLQFADFPLIVTSGLFRRAQISKFNFIGLENFGSTR